MIQHHYRETEVHIKSATKWDAMDSKWILCGMFGMLEAEWCCHLHVVAAFFSELRHIRISIMIIRLIIIIMMIILISSGRCCHLHVLLPRRWCCHRWDKVTPHRHSWRDKMDIWIFYFSTFILIPGKQCIVWYNTLPRFCDTLHLRTWHYTHGHLNWQHLYFLSSKQIFAPILSLTILTQKFVAFACYF